MGNLRDSLRIGLLLGFTWTATASGASHPAGVNYPLKSATLQPSGLAQPLPSTRRYVLVWPDQLVPDGAGGGTPYSQTLMQWVVTHYVGTQKLFQTQIDSYRAINANFLMLTYHLAYGLNGADQTKPVGNITGPNKYGQEDTDAFTPWVAAHGVTRENAYQHSATPATVSTRVSYPDPFWLMDIGSNDWQSYVHTTLLAWAAFPTAKATGIFLDVAFPPWYKYSPATWWTQPAGGASRQALNAWWMPRAQAYFEAMRTAFATTATHPRYIVIPNTDSLNDNNDEPTFLNGTDGVFTENWQNALSNSNDWNLTARRICHYVTGRQKAWMTDSTADPTTLPQARRDMIIGTYMLIRNATSYIMLLPGLYWFPEYEIDLGGYVDEPPDDIETLRIAGQGGAAGGLYARQEISGTVLVNSSSAPLTYDVPSAMKQAQWTGGGAVAADGTEATQTLTFSKDVPAGPLSVAAGTAVILRAPNGAPPAGVEPGGGADGGASSDATAPGNEGGPPAPEGGITFGADASAAGDGAPSTGDGAMTGRAGATDGGLGGAASGRSGGCGCDTSSSKGSSAGLLATLAGLASVLARRQRLRARHSR